MATGSRKVQLGAEFDSSGARKGFDQVKDGAADMASAVAKSGDAASKGLDTIGNGADASAKKTEGATRSLIASIQRTTAALEAGSRSSSDYYRELGNQRGVDTNALKPYLDQLDAVTAKQRVATQALGGGAQQLGAVGVSAAQTAAALRGVPAQFTDIVTSLQGGQSAITVFLQQGGQLKDMFGGAGAAARALGGYVAGLVNPFTIAIALAGGLALAYAGGAKEVSEYNKALVLSGNVAGATAGQMAVYAAAVGKATGSQSAAAEVITAFVAQGKVGAQNLQQFTQSALTFQKATGQAVAATVQQFSELGKSPVEASAKLNDQYNYLTASVYLQIKALQEQGRSTEAADLAQKSFATTLEQRSAAILQNIGSFERAWNAVRGAITGVVDAAKNVGRGSTPNEELVRARADLQARIDRGPQTATEVPGFEKGNEILRQRIAYLSETVRMESRVADEKARQAAQDKARIDFDKAGEQFLSKQAKMQQEITKAQNEALAAGIQGQALAERIAAIRDKYKESGAAGAGQSEVAAIQARIDAERGYLAAVKDYGPAALKWTDAEKARAAVLRDLQTDMTGATRAEKLRALALLDVLIPLEKQHVAQDKSTEAIKRSEAAYDAMVDATRKSAQSLGTQADELEASNVLWGKGRAAVEEYRLALIRTKLAEVEGGSDSSYDPSYLAQLRLQAANQERVVNAARVADLNALVQKQAEYTRAVQEEASAYANEAQLAGLTGVERAKVVAVRKVELDLAKRIAEIDATGGRDADSEAKREQLRVQARAAAMLEANTAVIRATTEEANKMADQIQTSLTDALLRGFESGKSFAQNLRDTVENMFKTLVLRPIVSAVINPVAQGITSALGLGGSGASAGGLLGSASNLASLYSSYTGVTSGTGLLGGAVSYGSVAAGLGASAGSAGVIAAGTAASEAAIAAGASAASAAASAGAAAGVAATGTTSITAALGAIGPAGWAAIGAVAIAGLVSGRGETRSGGQYATGADGKATFVAGPSGGQIAGDQSKALIDATVKNINDTFQLLGSSAAVASFGAGLESSGKGKGFDYAGGTLSTGASFGADLAAFYNNNRGTKTSEQAFAEFQLELQQSTIQALQAATDIPKAIQDQLRGVDADKLDAAGIQAVFDQINATVTVVKTFGAEVAALPFENLRNLSFDATTALIAAAGGMDKFNQSLTSYYDDFYTQEERDANTRKNLEASFAQLGLALPTTRDGFRALVEAQDNMSESGRTAWATLVGLEGAFASITPVAADAAKAQAEAAAKIKDAFQSVGDSIVAQIKRINGSIAGDGAVGFAYAQSQFAIATAQANAGDQAAAASLPELSQAVLDLAKTNATSALDLKMIQAQVLASLQATNNGLVSKYGITVPSFAVGTNSVPTDMLAQIHQGERIVPAADNRLLMQRLNGSGGDSDSTAVLLRVEQLLSNISAETRSSAIANTKVAKTLDRVTPGGDAITTRAAA